MFANIAISARIYGAFALVLLICGLIAGTSFLTMQHLAGQSQQLLATNVRFSTDINGIQSDVLALQRYEKEVFINVGVDAEAERSHRAQWQSLLAHARQGLESARQHAAGEDDQRALDGLDARIAVYAAGFGRVLRSVDNGRISSAVDANEKMAINRIATAEMERDMAAVHGKSSRALADLTLRLASLQQRATAVVAAACAAAMLLIVLLAWGISRSIIRPLAQAEAAANRMASSGDLTLPLPQCGNNEIGRTIDAFTRMTGAVKGILQEALQASAQCGRLGSEVTQVSTQVAQASAAQTQDIDGISHSVQALTTSIEAVSGHAEHVSLALRQNTDTARQGVALATQVTAETQQVGNVINDARTAIRALNSSSEQIGGIAGVIHEIADQTNLLALNAAIEAARAGEYGRGFAVVADEVRRLAERTSNSTQEITGVINSVRSEAQAANAAMQAASESIVHGIAHTRQLQQALVGIGEAGHNAALEMEQLSASIREQSLSSAQIASGVESMAEAGAQNSATASASQRVAAELGEVAGSLGVIVGRFRV